MSLFTFQKCDRKARMTEIWNWAVECSSQKRIQSDGFNKCSSTWLRCSAAARPLFFAPFCSGLSIFVLCVSNVDSSHLLLHADSSHAYPRASPQSVPVFIQSSLCCLVQAAQRWKRKLTSFSQVLTHPRTADTSLHGEADALWPWRPTVLVPVAGEDELL